MRRRFSANTVVQVAADGTLLASFSGQPADFAPFGVAVVQSDGGGTPLVVAVTDYSKSAIYFFQRIL